MKEGEVEKLRLLFHYAPHLAKRSTDIGGFSLRENGGGTVLHDAARHNQINILELALSYNADPNAPNAYGHTPLMLAALYNNEAVLKRLLAIDEVKQSINAQDKENLTALTLPLDYGQTDKNIIKLLLEHGACPMISGNGHEALDLERETNALDLAALKYDSKLVATILKSGKIYPDEVIQTRKTLDTFPWNEYPALFQNTKGMLDTWIACNTLNHQNPLQDAAAQKNLELFKAILFSGLISEKLVAFTQSMLDENPIHDSDEQFWHPSDEAARRLIAEWYASPK